MMERVVVAECNRCAWVQEAEEGSTVDLNHEARMHELTNHGLIFDFLNHQVSVRLYVRTPRPLPEHLRVIK